jgi:hypothetical protein
MTGAPARASHAPVGLPLAALVALAACPPVRAAQWSIEPQLAFLVGYNSNLLLVPTGQQASAEAFLDLDATLKHVTERTELDLHPHIELQRFPSYAALDANNGSIQGALTTKQERASFGLTGSYESVSTFTSEPSSTGIIEVSTRRETSSAGLTLGRDFSERQHVDLQGNFENVIYPGGEPYGLVGYRYPTVSLSDTFTLSERSTLTGGVVADELKAPLTGYEARDAGLRLSYKHTFSPQYSYSVTVGGTNTTVAGVTQHGYVWDLHGTHNSLLRQWDVDISQTLQPSGRGYLVRRDSATLSVAEPVSARLYATLALQFVRNEQVANGPFLDVPHYFTGDAGFDWHVAERVVVSVTGGYTELEEAVSYQLARGWHASINTRWTPVPTSVSR